MEGISVQVIGPEVGEDGRQNPRAVGREPWSEEITGLYGDEAPDGHGVEAPTRNLGGALVLGALACIVTGLVVWFVARSNVPAPLPLSVTRTVIPLPLDGRLGCCFEPMLAIASDGRTAAYVVQEDGVRRLYLRSMDSLEGQPIPDTESASMPMFSPDRRWVGFIAGGQLKKISVTGGAPVLITPGPPGRGATWAPDGTIVFTRAGTGLSRVSSEGGVPPTLTTPDFESREKTHRFPHVLPGGEAVLFTHASADIDSFDQASIAVLSLETGEHRILGRGGSNPHYVSSGHLVYARAGVIVAVPFDVTALEVTGPPVTVLEGVWMDPIAGNAEMAVSHTGHLLYAPGEVFTPSRAVVWVDRSGKVEPLTESTGRFETASLSPDGQRLAIWVGAANNSIWIYDIARATLTRLVSGFENVWPIWSPSGDRVTFASNRSGVTNLYWQVADGSAPPERLTTSEHAQSSASWSPDGRWLAYQQGSSETGTDIWVLPMEGDRTPRAFAQSASNEMLPQFSPDGHYIAYASDESGRYEVYVRPFPSSGRKWQVSAFGGGVALNVFFSWPALWSPNGRELFYRNGPEVVVVDVDTRGEPILGTPKVLFEAPSTLRGPFSISADGRRLLFVDRSEAPPAPTQLVLVQNWAEELKRLASAN